LIEDHLKPKEAAETPEVTTEAVADVALEVETPVEEPVVVAEIPDGTVDEETGVFTETPAKSTTEAATALIQGVIGARDLDKPDPDLVDAKPEATAVVPEVVTDEPQVKVHRCEVCSKDLSKEPDTDRVTLAWIKVRKRLCNEHWQEEQIARGFLKV
jgi:hypothetical protein